MIRKLIKEIKEKGLIGSIIAFKNHLILEFYKKFFSHNGLIMKQIHGNKTCLYISYPDISRDLVIYKPREELEVEILKKNESFRRHRSKYWILYSYRSIYS